MKKRTSGESIGVSGEGERMTVKVRRPRTSSFHSSFAFTIYNNNPNITEEMMIEMMIGMALAKDKSLGQLQTHDLMQHPCHHDLADGFIFS